MWLDNYLLMACYSRLLGVVVMLPVGKTLCYYVETTNPNITG